MSQKKKTKIKNTPVLGIRSMLGGITVLLLVLVGPFLAVWKQVYINDASLRLDALEDSLAVINTDVAALQLQCEQLSQNERIEAFARTALDLEYPTSDQIIVVPESSKKYVYTKRTSDFWVSLWQSFFRDRG
jgi:cell division protein FtsL